MHNLAAAQQSYSLRLQQRQAVQVVHCIKGLLGCQHSPTPLLLPQQADCLPHEGMQVGLCANQVQVAQLWLCLQQSYIICS